MFSEKLFFFTIVPSVLKEFLSSRSAFKYIVLSTLLYISEGLTKPNYVLPIVRNSLSDCPMPYYKAVFRRYALPVQGKPAFLREFAHMAAIGWTQSDGRIEWDCGGSLITEDIILTAAHCTSRNAVKPDVARMGDLNLFSDKDDKYAQQIGIVEIIRHENYKFSSNYFDIALLRLEHPIKVHDTVCPACLWNDANVEFPRLQATGWGATGFSEERTPILLKVSLVPNSNQECSTYYEKSRKLKNGITESQICAGDVKMDTCPGDSGGPLQIELLGSSRLTPFIVGVTSFGPACGYSTPAVYTRVSSYIDWIENKTKTSFNPIECTLRFIEFRDFEPDVGRKSGDLERLDFRKRHVEQSFDYSNKASLGFRNSKQEFSELHSGVLISENYVLTTASVINSNKITPKLVKFSYSDDIIEIDKIIIHPQFDPSSNEHDIALIRLKEDVEIIMDHQLPSCLWRNPTIPARQYTGLGRGPKNINGGSLTDYNITQLNLKLDLIESAECNRNYSSNLKNVKFRNQSIVSSNGITDSQFCAGYTRFFIVPGMCELDYGNTLQHIEGFLTEEYIYDFGLNSFGKECGFGIPAVFTRISSYVDWIDSVIFGNGGTTLQIVSEKDSGIHFSNDDSELGDKCIFSKNVDGECVLPESCQQLAKANGEHEYKPQLCSSQPSISVCCPHGSIREPTSLLNGNSNPPNVCTTLYLEEKIKYASPDYNDFGGKYEEFYRIFNFHSPLKVGEYPHTAVITWEDAGTEIPCFGALISLNFVLTTASCVSSKKGTPESVLLGVNSTKGGGAFEQKFNIRDVVFHPGFLVENVFDLALIKLDGIVKVNTFMMPACLWTNTTHTPFLLFSTGVSPKNDDLLVQRRLTRYNADCKRKYYSDLKDDELCGDAFLKKANNCEEKRGDILQTLWYENDVIHHYIVGFFARVSKCEVNPSIYIRITPYIEWINSILS